MLDTHRPLVPASVIALLACQDMFGSLIFAEASPQIASTDPTILSYRERQQDLLTANESITTAADAERRELTAEESRQMDDNAAEFDRLNVECARRQRNLDQRALLQAPEPRIAAPDAVGGEDEQVERPQARGAVQRIVASVSPRASVPAQPRAIGGGTNGFRSFGDFAQAVRHSSANGGSVDQRLMIRNATATSITQESVGSDGGFAVPPDYRSAIMTRLFDQDALLARCDIQQTSSNTFSAPIDETTPWGTGGIKAYWEKEAAAITQSKPSLGDVNLKLHKIAALVPITEEMLEDSASIDGYLRTKAPEAIDWSISFALAWGSGVREPLGWMISPALVTQAAEGAQTADTINATNVVKMLSRMPPRSRSTAVWLIHPDAEPQLPLMSIGQQPVYLPPGGLADAPLGRLLGRPVIPHEVCSTVGDLGDIMLVDLKQYLAVRKSAGVIAQTSIHLWFDQDLTAFKFTMRLGGQPWWSQAQSARSGSNTRSPFVTLAAR